MKALGPRIDFHVHSIFSDGALLPGALAYEAANRKHLAIAITDHVDPSNLEEVVFALTKFVKETEKLLPVKVLPGVELSYLPPKLIEKYAVAARNLGAKVVIVHGESPVEPVPKGTNHEAVKLKGIVDILAHPGWINEEDALLAKVNDIYLELSAKTGHRQGNGHVAKMAKEFKTKLLVNTDTHSEKDFISQSQAYQVALDAGLSREEAGRVVRDYPMELLKRVTQKNSG